MTELININPVITPLLTKSMTSQQLDEHRANVCMVMEVMVRKYDKFGWDQMSAGMRKMIRQDWLEALQDYPVQEVRKACQMHTQEMPSKAPNEGHIKQIILRERGKAIAAQPKPRAVEPSRPPQTDEQKARVDTLVQSSFIRWGGK